MRIEITKPMMITMLAATGTLAWGCSDEGGSGHGSHTDSVEAKDCFEFQRFHGHEGGGKATPAEHGGGEYTISNIEYLHGGSWLVNFMAMKDGTGDTLSLKLCIDGPYPSIEEAGGIDVTCRGDENAVGDVVHGDNGLYKAQLMSLDPDPQLAITADGSPMGNVVTFRLMDDADAPVEGAMIMKHPDCPSTGEGSHDGMHGGEAMHEGSAGHSG